MDSPVRDQWECIKTKKAQAKLVSYGSEQRKGSQVSRDGLEVTLAFQGG